MVGAKINRILSRNNKGGSQRERKNPFLLKKKSSTLGKGISEGEKKNAFVILR